VFADRLRSALSPSGVGNWFIPAWYSADRERALTNIRRSPVLPVSDSSVMPAMVQRTR